MPKFQPLSGLKTTYGKIGRRGNSPNLHLQGSFPGLGQRTISLGTPNIKEAWNEAKRVERELLRLDPHYVPKTVGEVGLQVIEINRPEWDAGTLEGAMNIIHNRIIPVFGDIAIDKFSEIHWSRYTEPFYKDHPNGRLFNTRKYLGKILRFAKRKGWCKEEFELPIKDTAARKGKNIPDIDLELIINSAKSFKKVDRKNTFRLIVYLGRYMGMRKNEILTLPVTDIDLKAKVIRLSMPSTRTKKHKRDMGIAPEVFNLLKHHLKAIDGRYVFPATRGMSGPMRDLHTTWDRACDAAKLDYNFHDTRHTFGTIKVLVEKKPIQDVAFYMGDSIGTLERIYLHPDVEHTRHVVEARRLKVVK